jgi:hypothetical protein
MEGLKPLEPRLQRFPGQLLADVRDHPKRSETWWFKRPIPRKMEI